MGVLVCASIYSCAHHTLYTTPIPLAAIHELTHSQLSSEGEIVPLCAVLLHIVGSSCRTHSPCSNTQASHHAIVCSCVDIMSLAYAPSTGSDSPWATPVRETTCNESSLMREEYTQISSTLSRWQSHRCRVFRREVHAFVGAFAFVPMLCCVVALRRS